MSSYYSTPDGCTWKRWAFSNKVRVSNKGLSLSTIISSPIAQIVWSANLRMLQDMDYQAVTIYQLSTPIRDTSHKSNQGYKSENHCN